MNKLDEFTNTNVVATRYNILVAKMFPLSLLNTMFYVDVSVDMEYTAKDTTFYLFINFHNNTIGQDDEADCISKDNKIVFVMSDKEIITLQDTKNYKGKKSEGTVVAGVVTSWQSEVAGSYLITKEAYRSLLNKSITKCRIEVMNGKDGTETKNYDFDILKNQTLIMDQLNCVLQKFNPKTEANE